MSRWWTIAAAVIVVLGTAVVPNRAASTPSITLAVPGRANANVSLAVSGSFVAAVWSASSPSGATDVFAATSRDSGVTFGAPTRVNSTPGDVRVNREQPPRIALKPRRGSAPEIAIVWTTKGTQGTRLMSAASLDGGRTFSTSAVVPGSDAAGNRGWESVTLGPGGRFFSAWLDHRKLASAQQTQMSAEHRHESGAAASTAPSPADDGVAMAQLSQLYVTSLDGTVAPGGITGGVCYCCKTAIAASSNGDIYVAWRHVYPGTMRDIAFTMSKDGGRTFAPPVRVSEDKWQLNGCPEDGPSMVVATAGTVHVIWPTVVTENGGPVKALFHASTRDGVHFTARQRIPTTGQANHPQLAIDSTGALAATWDEAGSGTRAIAMATGRTDPTGQVVWIRSTAPAPAGTYPVVISTGRGTWLRAWTSGPTDRSVIVTSRSSQ